MKDNMHQNISLRLEQRVKLKDMVEFLSQRGCERKHSFRLLWKVTPLWA